MKNKKKVLDDDKLGLSRWKQGSAKEINDVNRSIFSYKANPSVYILADLHTNK